MSEKKLRLSNLELLRIIAMIMIVAHHYAIHGLQMDTIPYSFNRYFANIISSGGKIGVNLFVLISGYFMINSSFTLKKFLKLIAQVYFYSVGILLLFLTILKPVNPISMSRIVKCVIPFMSNTGLYWFFTTYLVLMLLSPYINKLIECLDRKSHLKLILILLLIWSFFPTFMYIKLCFNDLGWFITLYLIAGYIRKYLNNNNSSFKYFLTAFIGFLILILSVIAINYLGHFTGKESITKQACYFLQSNSFIVVIVSISLFMGFLSINIGSIKPINSIASSAFGVYLIHDNIIMRDFIWQSIFKCKEMSTSSYIVLHAVFTIIAVYILCTIIDFVRLNTIDRLYVHILDTYLCKIKNFFKNKIKFDI